MARFTLVVRPDGRAVLTTADVLSDAERAFTIGAVREWQGGTTWPVLIVEDCEVVQVAELDIELPLVAAV